MVSWSGFLQGKAQSFEQFPDVDVCVFYSVSLFDEFLNFFGGPKTSSVSWRTSLKMLYKLFALVGG